MKIFGANATLLVKEYLRNTLADGATISEINESIVLISGIKNFFTEKNEIVECKNTITNTVALVEEPDRAEYGDFQTNEKLAFNVARYVSDSGANPDVLIAPTCGKGTFILASLKVFPELKAVYGVEIYKPYVWQAKFSILDFYLQNSNLQKPDIQILHSDVFEYEFEKTAKNNAGKKILVLGNPPWVTNATLGGLNSKNLPKKTNFKSHSGLDAMTGKGNFDIGESITLLMISKFRYHDGHLALLVKNSVIKNVVFDQKKARYEISDLQKHSINSKKEFGVSVEASLFFGRLNAGNDLVCKEFDFYENEKSDFSFGWVEDKFVSNIESYTYARNIDGTSPFEWRQGMKHDCSAIMELEKQGEFYINALTEKIYLEEDLVYGLLKSSDLKNTVISTPRKYTIVTQKKVGQSTTHIKQDYPNTYKYLSKHQEIFKNRKSSIYRNKPNFSIFGIGDYSFEAFKVAISGLYKTSHFSLVLPQNGEPLMLDDTCYMLGFNNLNYAVYTLILLNSNATKSLLQSITFSDAKRTFTKDVLMRIDLQKLSAGFSYKELEEEINKLNNQYSLNAGSENWNDYSKIMNPVQSGQMEMFSV